MVLGKFIHFLGAQQSTFSVQTLGPNCPGHFGTKRSIFALFYGEHPSEALYGMVCSSKWATNYAAARFSLSPTVFPFSLSPMPQSVTALAATQDHYQYRCNWKQLTQPNFTFSLEHIDVCNILRFGTCWWRWQHFPSLASWRLTQPIHCLLVTELGVQYLLSTF